jgi:glycosyltransferase involved in cell wall biosynthesis
MKLTIISPCFNESANIEELVERTQKSVKSFSEEIVYEHILIDNSSTDNSIEVMKQVRKRFPHVRILQNSENIGVFASMQRGLKASSGEWVVPFLAADMQDPPEVITEMLEKQIITGCDAVFGIRESRKENNFLFLLRKLFYFLLNYFMRPKKYVSGTSEFCLIPREKSLQIIEVDDPNPFLRIYLSQLNLDVKYVKFAMHPRSKGKSSASIFTLFDDALNAFSIVVPSIFSRLIVFLFPLLAITLLIFICLLFLWFLISLNLIYIWLSLMFIFILTLMIIQLLIGHYIFILHSQIRNKPTVDTKELIKE